MRLIDQQPMTSHRVHFVRLLVTCALLASALSIRTAIASADVCPAIVPATQPPVFSDTTDATGVNAPLVGMMGHVAASGDVNGDGWVDVFVGTFADRPVQEYQFRGASGPSPDRLLLGGPAGFTIDQSFPEMYGRSASAAFADLDGDADLDLVIGRNYRNKLRGNLPTVVMENVDGHLSIVTTLVTDLGARSIGVFDYDADGRLDLFVTEDHWSGGTSILFHNDGALQFSNVTVAAGLPANIHGLGVATSDLNADGRPDLLVSGSLPPTGQAQIRVARVFVNNGNATFRETDASVFTWTSYGNEDDAAGVAVGDLNRDGRPDVVIGQHYGSTLANARRAPIGIYLNGGVDGSGAPLFADVTTQSGSPGLATKSPHVEIVDFDNDGWADIVTTASAANGAQPVVLHNRGVIGGVPQFQASAGLGGAQYWPTATTADFDRDGRLDVFAVEWYPQLPSRLLRNGSVAAHWLDVELVGSGTGVGAVVELYCAGQLGQPNALIARRQIEASTGFGAGVLTRVHAGLGDQATADVRVRLPNGGRVIDRRNVTAGVVLRVPMDEVVPTPILPSLYVSDVRMLEGNVGATSAVFTMSLSAPQPDPVTVQFSTANGTATAPSDYTAIALTTLAFAPGETIKTVAVSVRGDTTAENDETFVLTLSNPTRAVLGDSQGTMTIVDEEGLPVVSVADASVVEGQSGTRTLAFPVTLSRPSAVTTSVTVSTVNVSAKAPTDYVSSLTNLSFVPGETQKSVGVVVNGDTSIEPNETLLAKLTSASGLVIGDVQATGTIVTDEPAAGPTPLPSVSVSDTRVVEGDVGSSSATFTVALSKPAPAGGVSVMVATANGTAKAAGDYIAAKNSTVRFAQGEIAKTVAVAVNGDAIAELNETFFVNLSNPVGVVLGDKQGVGTIIDEEGQPIVRVSDTSVVEGHAGTTAVTVTVVLSRVAPIAVEVSVATAAATASAPADFTALPPTKLTFAPGETTKSVVIAVVGDTAAEPNETFAIDVTLPVGVVLGDGQATVTIANDD